MERLEPKEIKAVGVKKAEPPKPRSGMMGLSLPASTKDYKFINDSAMRDFLNSHGVRCSKTFYKQLNMLTEKHLWDAMTRAMKNGKKTVQPQDI